MYIEISSWSLFSNSSLVEGENNFRFVCTGGNAEVHNDVGRSQEAAIKFVANIVLFVKLS